VAIRRRTEARDALLPLLAAAALALGAPARAAEIRALTVEREGARFHVEMEVQLAAAAARAFAVFADAANLPRINPAVRVARPLYEAGAQDRLYTEVYLCVAVFCRSLHQVQDLSRATQPDGRHLVADVLPARSDFRYGHAEWIFAGDDKVTDLQLHMEVEPAFWVPPLIGNWFAERLLREQAELTAAGIERLAAS